MKSKVKKTFAILLIVLLVFPVQILEVFAVGTGESYYLQRAPKAFYSVQKKNDEGNWVYITYEVVYYIDENGKQQIAYCMNPDLPGVGWAQGSVEGYEVELTQMVSDVKIWRICINGYPYKGPTELGVETHEDAYLATKQAINCILRGYTPNEVYKYFRAGEFAIDGQELDEIQRRGTKVVDAIYNLVSNAYTSTQTPANSNSIKINKVNNLEKDNKQGYYSQECTVTSSINIDSYTIVSKEGFPEGTIITDINGNEKAQFSKDEKFKILIPESKMSSNINGTVQVEVKSENYPIFFGESKIFGYQDYAVCCDPYGDILAKGNIDIKTNTGKIIVNKTDKDTNEPIQGVTFELLKQDGTKVKEVTTDKQGVAKFEELYTGKYILKEIKADESYVVDSKQNEVKVEYNQTTTINITNEKKKGQIKIVKVDKDNNQIRIPDVVFEILDENKTIVDTIKTDTNGESISKRLPIDKTYTVREIQTKEEYVLSNDIQTVTLEQNQIKELKFENEKKKGQIKIIKVDEEFKEIKIADVEFDIYNSKGEIVDHIVTNAEGEVITKRLPINDKYTIKETKSNRKYLLNENEITVTLKQDEITEQVITNEHKKGNLIVYKVDNDNQKLGLGGVEFQLFSEEFNKIIQKYITDADGNIEISDLRIGNYKLIETKTNKWYNLAEDTNIEIQENTTTTSYIENELKKGQVRVIKQDKENNQIKLEGVKFEVLDEQQNVLEVITTDENGEALTSKYPIRDFETLTLKEIETKEEYRLLNETKTVTLKENEIIDLVIENERKKGKIEIVKLDKDNQKIKLQNVEFQILDYQNNIVDTLITNKDGQAISKDLPVGEYLIKETKTGKDYVLREDKIKVEVEDHQVSSIEITNEKKKGQIQIIKTSKDNNEIIHKEAGSPISNVEFEIIDKQGNVIDKIKTDAQGIAMTKRLECGTYKIKEINPGEGYILNENEFFVNITKDKEIVNLSITNESQKPVREKILPRTGY